jgi:thimet oligopeptidase
MKTIYIISIVASLAVILLFFSCTTCHSRVKFPVIQSVDDIIHLFPKTPAEIEKKKKEILKITQNAIKEITSIEKVNRTFENTIRALDYAYNRYRVLIAALTAIKMVHPDEAMRNAANKTLLELQEWAIENLTFNKQLYNAFKEYVEVGKEALTDEEKYYIEESIRDYEKIGLNLPQEKQDQLKTISKTLSELSLKFQGNINTDNSFITATKEELAGLDEMTLNGLKKNEEGLYSVGVDYPTYFAVMDNVIIPETRRKLWLAFNNRAYPANESILNQVIALRDEKAQLLGYESYAHLSLDDAMAKNPETVQAFLADLNKRGLIKAQQEVQTICCDLPMGITTSENNKIYPWDWSYIQNQYKKKYLTIDEEKIKEYFELNHTLQQLLSIYEEFFSIKFEQLPIKSRDFWHEDVSLIGVYDLNKKLIGYILLDLHPRANKYTHACQIDIIPAFKTPQIQTPAVAVVIANFPKGSEGNPSLLKRTDVITFFHEFGHALHSLFGSTSMISFSGTRVKGDFVEMPSQMLEYWMWQPEILQRVSKHYQTGEPISDELIEKLQALKQFDAGNQLMRQVYYAYLSLDLHLQGAQKNIQLIKDKYAELTRPYIMTFPEDHLEASFGHLMGYGAGYYGYQWSNVYAADLFGMIKELGLTNPEIGKRYKDIILARGGSIAPDQLLVEFLGRAPSTKAYFDDIGLNN